MSRTALLVSWAMLLANSSSASGPGSLAARLCGEYETAQALETSIKEDLPALEEATDIAETYGPQVAELLPHHDQEGRDSGAIRNRDLKELPTQDTRQASVAVRIDACEGEAESRVCHPVVLRAHYAAFVHCDLPHLMPGCEGMDDDFAAIRSACISVTLDPGEPQRQELSLCSMAVTFAEETGAEGVSVFDSKSAERIDYVVMRPQGTLITTPRGGNRISVDGFWYRPPVRVTRIYEFSDKYAVQYNQGHPCTMDPRSHIDLEGRSLGEQLRRHRQALQELIKPVMTRLWPIVQ